MNSFGRQNFIALVMGFGAALISHYLLDDLHWLTLVFITLSGYVGGHLPHIQQPSSKSYQVVRAMSAVAAVCLPVIMYLYRPTDLLLAWFATYLLYQGGWRLLDRVSLYRDYTHTLAGIIVLPMIITGIAFSAIGDEAVVPVFMATSLAYIVELLLEQRKIEPTIHGVSD